MDQSKEIRWKQRFENFSRSYKLLDKYAEKPIETELERAGIIQFFEMTFELSWKVLKDYLEMQGYKVSSPREAIKQAFQIDLIENGHVWMEALTKRNLTTHTYDEEMAKEFVEEITVVFLPEFKLLYERLLKEE
ncbi:HI0074 family nucleotidyltransferase substrate-binding subunit [Virgibacillus dakarensis]|uniref:nucleotidyltransferase substrate binding protein n=1 Tax=Virgibacillus dakarensis TaxID=1917889 RepID=UPI000B443208|nr:nucleotidyltransferase substrate binding protein [Virgibacillus dakarensis]MBT2215534.1 HI0074 family nucleotidyltransferase substrate-binding subunit [Virgibacillus dakarensis]